MKVRRIGCLLVLALICASASASLAMADEEEASLPGEFSANIAFTTDYVYRGISQTSEDVALQPTLDWNHESGVYLGVWGSNIDFKDGSSQLELDIYGGYANEYEGISYDVMILGYVYPGADRDLDQDFVEFSLALGYDFGLASVNTGVAISPDFYGATGVGAHITAGVGVPIPIEMLTEYGVAVDANYGYQDIEEGGSYSHWNVGLGAEVFGFGLDLRYFGNDVDSIAPVDDDRVVFTFSRSF
jgi:uncharacterized protein (TIGR02001 family)